VQQTEFPTIGHTVQTPRVPIWCVAALGRARSMERARRWDGIIPQVVEHGDVRQPDLAEIGTLRDDVDDDRIDIVVEGPVDQHSPAAYAEAGATWWIESMWNAMSEHSPATAAYDRLVQGPPA
jgi:hypothetical protein